MLLGGGNGGNNDSTRHLEGISQTQPRYRTGQSLHALRLVYRDQDEPASCGVPQQDPLQKICPDHGEVGNDQIVSGYKYSKDQYVIIEPEELAKIRKQSNKSINIDGFIDARKLDPIYHSGRTYYLLPDGPGGQKPYSLLLRSMRKNKVNAYRPTFVLLSYAPSNTKNKPFMVFFTDFNALFPGLDWITSSSFEAKDITAF